MTIRIVSTIELLLLRIFNRHMTVLVVSTVDFCSYYTVSVEPFHDCATIFCILKGLGFRGLWV